MDRNNALILGGVSIASVITFGLYYYFGKNKKIQLNDWFEEYIKELQTKLLTHKDNPTVELILDIFFLSSELEDYLYLNENQDLEDARLDNINNKERYEQLVLETEKRKSKCTLRGIEYVERKLDVSFGRLQDVLKDADKAHIRRSVEPNKKSYIDLPELSTEKVREAYKSYVHFILSRDHVTKQQLAIVERNPEYEQIAMKIIQTNRCLTDDTIRKNFGVRPKYLQQLVREHKLLDEPEILGLYEKFHSLS
jgi:hypothetical protein